MAQTDLSKLKIESQRRRERKRVKDKTHNKGRPPKTSGVYYNHLVGLSPKAVLLIRRNKLPGEPLGSSLDRLLGIALQKKVGALLENFEPIEEPPYLTDPDLWNKMFEFYDEADTAKRSYRKVKENE